jgi:hypothetical protein
MFLRLTNQLERAESSQPSTKQGPSWAADSNSADKEIPHLLWKQKIHYRAYKSRPLDPTLNPVHILTSCTFTIHFNTVFSSELREVVNLGTSQWNYKIKIITYYEFYYDILNFKICINI